MATAKPLDPRFELAFGAHRTRALRVIAARALSVMVAGAIAVVVRHWAAWVVFALIAFTQGGGAFLLFFVQRPVGRLRARLEADERELVWLHSEPEKGSAAYHRVELFERAGDMIALFVTAGVANGAIEAARALAHAPTVTTNAGERAAAEPRHRLAGKLEQLERAALATEAPKLAQQAPVATAAIAVWRAQLARASAHPYRAEHDMPRADLVEIASGPLDGVLPDVEARIDELLHLYASAKLGESHRVNVAAIVRDKKLPDGLFEGELFTREIASKLAELEALAAAR